MEKPVVIFTANRGYALSNSRTGMIRRFLDAGWQVVLATANDEESRALCKLGASLEIIDIDRGGFSPVSDFRALWRLVHIYRKWNPCLIHQFHAKPVILGTLAARYGQNTSVRIVNTITGLGHAFVSGGIIAYLTGMGYLHSLSKADMTIFQNSDDQNLFLEKGWVSEQRALLIAGSGVDLRWFSLVDRLKHNNLKPTVVMLGRLLGQKGVREFAEVAGYIRSKWPHTQFLWAGEEDLIHPDSISAKWFQTQPDVKYLGRLENVVPLLKKADILLFTSYYREGLPRVILEAAAMGLPTVAFDVPGVREVVKEGETGYLVLERDVDALGRRVEKLLTDVQLRFQMGQKARDMVEQLFDIRSIEQRYFDVYRNIGIKI